MPEADDSIPEDDALYEKVWGELEDGSLNRGLWARCYAEVDGHTERAKARYIKARVAQLAQAEKDRQDADFSRLRDKQRSEREAHERRRAAAEAEAQRQREDRERQDALRQKKLQEEREKEERRKGLHGREAQEQQEEADFAEILVNVRKRNSVNPANVEVEKIDTWGCTRLIRAAQSGRYEEILLMVAEGDDPTHSDSSGMRARAHSEVRGHDKCAHFLEIA
ncbi:MAG: hypothetical protein OET44_07720, partial [Gammaproteobacteria bacterium]|nr:hypothetical protein [Gammaproteobacteria bacterium]